MQLPKTTKVRPMPVAMLKLILEEELHRLRAALRAEGHEIKCPDSCPVCEGVFDAST